ncbi:MAG: 23S rRNA (guanosine(2251)-2'-O)-methyltransferase RlmB [Gammaproteobacteria bacterium]|nr:23S rRNA (guanosine(2251)-2'-O)-methyltransferase RlmB [Gammaproteobacteria bacterium]
MSNAQRIFGLHAVTALLKANPGSVKELFVDKKRQDKRMQELVQLAKQSGVRITLSQRDELDKQAGNANHQGIAALCDLPQPHREEFLDGLLEEPDHPLLLLVLDGVQDPHNLGACLRTADAVGADAVIIPKDRSVSVTSTVVKVASGAAYTVPVVSVTNLSRTMFHLQEVGVWFVGTDGAATQSLYELNLTGPIGIVLGAEGTGMRRLTKEKCDYLVQLPMRGSVESLNVSVAAGVCLYEVLRQRAHKAIHERSENG